MLCFYCYFSPISTPDILAQGPRVCSLVNRETLLELRSKLRSDALPATTIDFFWDSNPQLAAHKSCILTIKPRPLQCCASILVWFGPIRHRNCPVFYTTCTLMMQSIQTHWRNDFIQTNPTRSWRAASVNGSWNQRIPTKAAIAMTWRRRLTDNTRGTACLNVLQNKWTHTH